MKTNFDGLNLIKLFKLIEMKKLFLFLIGITYFLISYGQSEIDTSDIVYYAEMENYFRTQMEEDTNAIKKYVRYEAKIKKKLDQYGSLNTYQRATNSACVNACPSQDLADWQLVSDYVYEDGNVQWNGFVNRISPDPREINNPEPATNALLGLPSGGLFKFDGTKWIPKTDMLNEYGLGITEILRNADYPNNIMISTGIEHTGDYGTSAGLYTSANNGDNWLPWNLASMFPGFDPCKTHIIGLYYNYDFSGTPNSTNTNFFLIERQHGRYDKLWEWCPTAGGAFWIDQTPQEYINRVTISNYLKGDQHLQLVDFTATANSMVLTTSSPFNNAGAAIFHAQKSGSCNLSLIWTDNTGSLPGFSVGNNQNLAVSDYNGSVIFARSKGNNNNTLYSSTDGGLTWLVETNSIVGGTKLDMEYSPQTNLVYLGETYMKVWDYTNKVLHSANSLSQHADIRDIKVIGIDATGKERSLVANDGGVSITTDEPASSSINSPGAITHRPVSGTSMPIQQVWGLGITQSINVEMAKGDMHNNSFAYIGGSWCKFAAGDGGDVEINHTDNSTMYFSINSNVKKGDLNSICGSIGTQIFNTSQWQFGRPLELHPANQCKLFFGDDYNCNGSNPPCVCSAGNCNFARLIVYNDCNSTSLTKINLNANVVLRGGGPPNEYMTNIGSIGLTEAAPEVIYLGFHDGKAPNQSGMFLKSINNGNSWIDLSFSPITNVAGTPSLSNRIGWWSIEDIIVSPYDENLVFLSISGTHNTYRVFKSIDGGNTFIDFSDGLPALATNAFEYQYNSNDRLFLGTDAGVYFRDNTMSQWVCFTENLGLVWTTDLDINYCNNELYATTYGRGVYETSLNTLTNVRRFHRITSNTTWNYDKVIYSDVIIEPGVTLDITGAKIQFAEGKRIIVNPTAQLNVLNSELTNLCDNSCWDGITVEGNSNQPQTLAFQGKAYLNGSTISNAKNAINILGVDETTPNLDTDWSQMGGIIEAVISTFINNRRDAQFLGYENIISGVEVSNVSIFDKCSFIIDDNYLNYCGSNSPSITMWHLNGITIKNCTFEDKRTTHTNPSDYRGGIYSGNSAINAFNNTFIKLYKGIELDDIQASFPITSNIKKNTFLNCETGIRLTNYNKDAEICDNYVSLGHPKAASSFGIVAHNSSGFIICDNVCEKDNTYPQWTQAYDILNTINANNPNILPFYPHNLVVNNTSINNNNGFVAWGDNMAIDGQGLEFICNTNIGNTNVDFRFLNCIQIDQGSTLYPAGNTFSGGTTLPIAFETSLPWSCDVSLSGGKEFNYYKYSSSSPVVVPSAVNLIPTNNTTDCSNYVPCAFVQVFDEEGLNGNFEAQSTIFATQNVGSVTFSAGERITLLPGFSTSSNLKCTIGSCTVTNTCCFTNPLSESFLQAFVNDPYYTIEEATDSNGNCIYIITDACNPFDTTISYYDCQGNLICESYQVGGTCPAGFTVQNITVLQGC